MSLTSGASLAVDIWCKVSLQMISGASLAVDVWCNVSSNDFWCFISC